MKITLKELNEIFGKIIKKLENTGFNEILLYEDLCINSFYELTKKRKLCIGSIKDEIEDFNNIIRNEDKLINTVFFERFAYLLILIQLAILNKKKIGQEYIKITTYDLKKIFCKLTESANFFGFNEIYFDNFFYNKICIYSITDFTNNEPKICIGSLQKDASDLKKILNNKKNLEFHDFEKFSAFILSIHSQYIKQ